ncbi:TIR domain-containing protein [Sphingopyxis yananensis]|uniref:TIR domain-containing protein n=1 Tax=Sphingopyxis yananensis TaxID=2886687 RepID=UPI001D11DA62|nr:TIR domain-containing protein [Sphingopyxis yananensis]MCC2601574.1 TIR domain-containing protein [Sphingopyxis yananensis]
MSEESAIIFLSYASGDYDRVHEYYAFLVGDGLDPWLDKEKLVAGQNWDFEIKRALRKSAIIVIFLSQNSVTKRGYVQREIAIALDQSQARLHDDIYVIPVMLDDVLIPTQLEAIQVIGIGSDDPRKQLSLAISTQLDRLGLENAKLQGDAKLRWNMTWYRDKWEGLLGYETAYQIPRFFSDQFPQANEISDVIRGWAVDAAMSEREVKFSQESDFYSFGQDPYRRTNTWEAWCNAPVVHERMISITYSVSTMGAGAMHPNQHFKTFSFTLSPMTQVKSLDQIFADTDSAFKVLQEDARHQLMYENDRFIELDDEGGVVTSNEPVLDEDWVVSGTSSWSDFCNFIFAESGVEILFPPYQVAAYAFGPQMVKVDYDKLAKFMHKNYAYALGVEYLQRDWPQLVADEATPASPTSIDNYDRAFPD